MLALLTGSPCGRYREGSMGVPMPLNSENDFIKNLSARWREDGKGLLLSAAPERTDQNDRMFDTLKQSFELSGFSIHSLDICDTRSEGRVQKLSDYDFLILSGGHVPTQNAFFQKIGLREKLRHYDGIVIGISAGTMNSADLVYAQPEEPGETDWPRSQRFLKGLNLTDIMILPHYQAVKDDVLDGKRLYEDVTYPDSMGREFYAIVDGSYLMVDNGMQKIYGECYRIADGKINQAGQLGQILSLGQKKNTI